jgi:hypothetical protein
MYFGPQDDPYVPVQLGLGVHGGAEIAAHLVRSVVEAHGGDASFALRTFAFSNPFNEVSGQKILGIAQEQYTELLSVREDVLCESLSPLVGWAQDDVRMGGPAGEPARTFALLPRHSPCPD